MLLIKAIVPLDTMIEQIRELGKAGRCDQVQSSLLTL